MTQQPISVVGAGIGGLTLARCLLKHGIPTVVYEKMPSARRHNYAITLHPTSYRRLQKLLKIDEKAFKTRVAVDSAIGGSGAINSEAVARRASIDLASFRAHRGKLEELLREGLDIQWAHGLEKVEETPSGMRLNFHNGKSLKSSCIIAVDGPHSNTRKSLLPETQLNVLPFVVFNGKRKITRTVFDSLYAPSMRESNVVELKRGDVIMNVSINEHSADEVSVNWIYSRPARGPTDPLHKPDRSNSGATIIPEAFFQEIKALTNLDQPFKDMFDEEKLKTGRILHWLMRTVMMKLEDLQALRKKGVFFMGDAVHAEPILSGKGANAAIIDGIELAECIANSGVAGIPSWYQSLYPSWQRGVSSSEAAIQEMHMSRESSL